MVAQQLATINTDVSVRKLEELIAAQDDRGFAVFIMRSGTRYVPVEELGRRWQEKHDTTTLNQLYSEWLDHIYEGYPLKEVITVMGQPQRSGPHYVHYVSKENHALYLEINDAGEIGGTSRPK